MIRDDKRTKPIPKMQVFYKIPKITEHRITWSVNLTQQKKKRKEC
jgi:hypothetical protein